MNEEKASECVCTCWRGSNSTCAKSHFHRQLHWVTHICSVPTDIHFNRAQAHVHTWECERDRVPLWPHHDISHTLKTAGVIYTSAITFTSHCSLELHTHAVNRRAYLVVMLKQKGTCDPRSLWNNPSASHSLGVLPNSCEFTASDLGHNNQYTPAMGKNDSIAITHLFK